MVELLNRISLLCNILGTCHLLEVAGGLVQMGGGSLCQLLHKKCSLHIKQNILYLNALEEFLSEPTNQHILNAGTV